MLWSRASESRIQTSEKIPVWTGSPGQWVGASLLLLLLLGLYLGSLGLRPMMDPDEGRYLEIPREMVASGDFVTPRLDGVLYYEKPPLHYWLTAGAIQLLGTGALAARLPGAIFGLIGLAGVILLGRSMMDLRAGLLAALILASSPLYLALSRVALTDMVLAVFVELSLICFWLARQAAARAPETRRAAWWWRGVFAFAALAVMTKGLIGIVIPGCVIAIFLVASRSWRVLRSVPWISGPATFLAIAAPWHVLIALRDPHQLWFYFVHEHLLRYTTSIADREQSLFLFVPVILLGALPWTAWMPRSLKSCWQTFGRDSSPRGQASTFLWSWILFVFLFFSLSHSKLIPYILPLLPALALVLAFEIAPWQRGDSAGARRHSPEAVAGGTVTLILGLLLAAAAVGAFPGFTVEQGRIPWLAGIGVLATIAAGGTLISSRRMKAAALLCGLSGIVLYAGLEIAAPAVAPQRFEGQRLAGILENRLEEGERVYAYGCYPQSIPPFLGRTIGVAGYLGELGYGISRLEPAERIRRFPTLGELKSIWTSPHPVWIVVDRPSRQELRAGLNTGSALFTSEYHEIYLNAAAWARRGPRENPPAMGAGPRSVTERRR